MNRDIQAQIEAYFDYVSDVQGAVDVLDIVDPVAPVPTPPVRRPRTQGWWVVVAAAVAAVSLIAILPTLFDRSATNQPADSPATETPQEPQPETPTPTIAEAVAPITFTTAAQPSAGLDHGVWFNNRLYAATEKTLYSTSNGFDWEEETGFEVAEDDAIRHLTTDGRRLVAFVDPGQDIFGSEACRQPGDALGIHVLDTDGDWRSSTIDLEVPIESSVGGCIQYWPSSVVVGSGGILVTGSRSASMAMEGIIESELGPEVVENLSMVQPTADGLIVSWNDDTETAVINYEEIGIADSLANFAEIARPWVGSTEGDSTWFGETPIAWMSATGTDWTRVDKNAPAMRDHQIRAFPTDDGFIVVSDYHTASFLNVFGTWTEPSGDITANASRYWESQVHNWNGEIVLETDNGVIKASDPETVLIEPDAYRGYGLFFGADPIFGATGDWLGPEVDPDGTVAYSLDGTAFSVWAPPEFADLGEDPMDGGLSVVGVGDTFVVLRHWASGQLYVGEAGTP